jgi:hypothetical protein
MLEKNKYTLAEVELRKNELILQRQKEKKALERKKIEDKKVESIHKKLQKTKE